MARFVSLIAAGVAQGAIAALIALGIVLLHKATGVVNFAQGDLLTLGAYTGYWLIVRHRMPTLPAYLITVVLVFLVGVAIERVGYAPLRKQPILAVLISTFALALGLRSLIILWQSADDRNLPSPFGAKVWHVAGAAIPYQNILIVIATLVVFAALSVLLQRTAVGRQVRALAADRETALLQGIRVERLSIVMFGLSAALAGLGGMMVAPTLTVTPTLGFPLLLASFAAVVLGGFDRIGGTVAAAFAIAIVQQLLGGYVSHTFIEAYPYLILLGSLMIRPEGFVRGVTGVRY
jgi:branched-chain amino acid transport system permease protein